VLSSSFGSNSVQATSEIVDPQLGHYGRTSTFSMPGGMPFRSEFAPTQRTYLLSLLELGASPIPHTGPVCAATVQGNGVIRFIRQAGVFVGPSAARLSLSEEAVPAE
jgi:hypothetical protein